MRITIVLLASFIAFIFSNAFLVLLALLWALRGVLVRFILDTVTMNAELSRLARSRSPTFR